MFQSGLRTGQVGLYVFSQEGIHAGGCHLRIQNKENTFAPTGGPFCTLLAIASDTFRGISMRKFLSAVAIVVTLSGAAHAQDFQKGLEAAQAGDFATALQEFRPLAEQGNAGAQYNVGLMYYNGWGVPQDYKEAAKWYRKAAEQGHADAQYNLGVTYVNGLGVPQDYKIAASWYRKAAEQGDAFAQNNLGLMYDDGQGVLQDYKEAANWYLKAAEQGNAEAQFNLGVMYRKGRGVSQDYKEAVMWYRKAAEQGGADAQTNLGYMYNKGLGVLQDNVLAHMWYNISSANGPENGARAKNRDIVAKRMSQEAIEKAQAMARDCMASNYQNCGD